MGRESLGIATPSETITVMCELRLRIRNARPCARGRIRFMVGPSSTKASLMVSFLVSMPWLFAALATALASALPTGSLAACGANRSIAWASSAFIPRMRSITRRAFMGVTRTYRAWALASIAFPLLLVITDLMKNIWFSLAHRVHGLENLALQQIS